MGLNFYKRKKLVWTLEKKDPQDSKKFLEDCELTEEEINTVLYEIAIGAKTLASKKKADETNTNEQTLNGKPFHRLGNFWMYVVYGVPVGLGAGLALFWKQISSWWSEPEGSKEDE